MTLFPFTYRQRRLARAAASFGRRRRRPGAGGKLYDLAGALGSPQMCHVPDGVGGRFSVLSAVGLLPAAILAIEGTNQAYQEDGRPTVDIRLPTLDEASIGRLLQMLMLATVVEGRLIGINPYVQPGVEKYKQHMNARLRGS